MARPHSLICANVWLQRLQLARVATRWPGPTLGLSCRQFRMTTQHYGILWREASCPSSATRPIIRCCWIFHWRMPSSPKVLYGAAVWQIL
jgi:hypothetical protein